MRAAIAALVLAPLALAGFGVGNGVAFNAKAVALEQRLKAAEAAGVSAQQLAPAHTDLTVLRERHVAFLPFSVFSGALLFDPFSGPEDLVARSEAEALPSARDRATDDLAQLKEAGGPNYSALQQHQAELASAHTLADYVKLARSWESETAHLTAIRDQLAQASGGLSDGLPKDVVDGVARLQGVISTATQAQLSPDPGAQALVHAQSYLKEQYPALLAQHDAIASEVKSAGDAVQHRVDLRVQGNQLVGRLPELLTQAAKFNIASATQAKATQAKSDVLAAQASGDDARVDAATTALKQAIDQLSAAVTTAQKAANSAALAAGTGCVVGEPAQFIVIHLATQKLVAYDNGCPWLTTLVTTGRAGLRTDRGTFTIHAKFASYLMHSPWQPSTNPLWYPDTTVHDAMQFNPADGSYIHSAEWEPESAYGPGSEDGPYHSHGCVHVMNGPLASLYNWTKVGATVLVTD
jgi:lipoprotein-anchoring transpeptidase ErfK/SrfK